MEIEGQYHNVYVIKRPGVDQFMKRVGELYEVVVFTASVSKVLLYYSLQLPLKWAIIDVYCFIVWRPASGPIGYSSRCASSPLPRKLLQPPGELREGQQMVGSLR